MVNELLAFFLSRSVLQNAPRCKQREWRLVDRRPATRDGLTSFPELPGLLPTGWFRKGSFGIFQSCRELASKEMALPNSLHKSSVPL